MATLRSYLKPEQAYVDAAFLCSMGLDASVHRDAVFGGNVLGASEAGCRIEVLEEQLEQAREMLDSKSPEEARSQSIADLPDEGRLLWFFRALLFYDVVCMLAFAGVGAFREDSVPEPVAQYLSTLAFSNTLWEFAYFSYWPLVALVLVSNVLCFFFSRLGRSLYLASVVWGVLTQLGPPPAIYEPTEGFFVCIQTIVSSIALALMFWSPLQRRFMK